MKGERRVDPKGRGSVPRVGQAHTSALATETVLATKDVPKRSLMGRSAVMTRQKWKVEPMCVHVELKEGGTGEAAR